MIVKKLSILVAISIIISMLMVGCSKSVIPVNPAKKDSTHTPNNDSKQEDDQYTPNDDSKRQNDLQSWAGAYKFTEYAPPDENMFYRVSILEENGEYYGDIYIDGFQTLTRIRTKVLGDAESITLSFLEYLPENTFESFIEGDILLSFKKKDSKLYTFWGEIQPLIPENAESRKICFELEPE